MKYVLRPLFAKFQPELLAFSNTKEGRTFISQFGGKEIKENYKVVKVTPVSIHQHIDKNTYRAIFYSRSPYVKLFGEVLTMMDIASENNYHAKETELIIPHYLGETNLLNNVLPRIYLETGTFNPDANPESTSVDGTVLRSTASAGETWSTLRGGAGTVADDDNTSDWSQAIRSGTTSNQWNILSRSIFLFDTSTLPDSATLNSATLSLYGTAKTDGATAITPDINIYTSTPASNTSLATSDYGQTGTVPQCDTAITYANWSTSGYNDFVLNSTGLGNISKTDISKFAGKNANYDVANSAPTWSSGEVSHNTSCNFGDNASNKPKLVVTYTVSGSFFYFM
jgi:hypothetical protein